MADLVILHGPPASGKLTTAKRISALTGAAVFHNHLTLDVAKSLFEFGTDEFWNLVHDIRVLALNAHYQHGSGTLLFTWCYEHPKDAVFLERISEIAIKFNGRILPVFINCTAGDLELRVANPERKQMDKLCTINALKECLSNKHYAAIPYKNCIEIDSGANTAEFNAQRIIESFDL